MRPSMQGVGQVWASADAYEPYVGRWSRLVAREFLAWLRVAPDALWLDVGCGTGALSQTIMHTASARSVTAIDRSSDYVTFARKRIGHERARFAVSDAVALCVADAPFDVAVSGLVLNFVPDPAAMVREMRRVVRSNGWVALYVWDYAGQMQLMRYFWDAATALDPTARTLDEGARFALCQPKPLSDLFQRAGLQAVQTRALDVPTVFKDFDDYWSPFLGGQGPAGSFAVALSDEKRTALRDYLEAHLPIASDGSIHLLARAWAVQARVP